MKTNSDTTSTLYIELDVHKEQSFIDILDDARDAELRPYGSVNTAQHALEQATHYRVPPKISPQLSERSRRQTCSFEALLFTSSFPHHDPT